MRRQKPRKLLRLLRLIGSKKDHSGGLNLLNVVKPALDFFSYICNDTLSVWTRFLMDVWGHSFDSELVYLVGGILLLILLLGMYFLGRDKNNQTRVNVEPVMGQAEELSDALTNDFMSLQNDSGNSTGLPKTSLGEADTDKQALLRQLEMAESVQTDGSHDGADTAVSELETQGSQSKVLVLEKVKSFQPTQEHKKNSNEVKGSLPDGVWALKLLPVGSEACFSGYELLDALAKNHVHLTEKKIFARFEKEDGSGQMLFYVASEQSPGTFDVSEPSSVSCSGVVVIFNAKHIKQLLPAFQCFIDSAKQLSVDLGGTIQTMSGQTLTADIFHRWHSEVVDFCVSRETKQVSTDN